MPLQRKQILQIYAQAKTKARDVAELSSLSVTLSRIKMWSQVLSILSIFYMKTLINKPKDMESYHLITDKLIIMQNSSATNH